MRFSNWSLKAKLILAFLVTGTIPLVVSTFITWNNNSNTLRTQAADQLKVFREARATRLEEAFGIMQKQAITLSENRMTVSALKAFSSGFDNYVREFSNKPSLQSVKNSVESYYSNQFGAEYAKKNNDKNTDTGLLVSSLSTNGLGLQYSYISNNKNPLGSKNQLLSAEDGTSWSKSHREFHPSFNNYLEKFGYYDIFLIEAKHGNVVYSVFKELDFATSVKNGAYSKTGLAEAAQKAFSATHDNEVFITDLATYLPSYDFPAGFISSAIFENGKVIGALVFQIPVSKIDEILTNRGKWKEAGQGLSGETYIIGHDFKMRSTSRFLIEDPKGYFDLLADKMPHEDLEFVRAKNTTTLAQTVDSEGAKAAVAGRDGFSIFPDYRGEMVFSSYRPLKINGLNWYLLSEIDEAEALAPVYALTKLLLTILSLAMVTIVLMSWFLTTGIAKTIIGYVTKLEEASTQTLESSRHLNEASQKVSSSTTEQASAIQETVSTLNEISAMGDRTVEYAAQSTEKAENSFKVSEEGRGVVAEMEKSMAEIAESNRQVMDATTESSKEIGEIVEVINSIAQKTNVINDIVFQTKLLSFNASVEAARAGEHGKGFAVVAEEVGNLAQMSGSAAKEIAQMLEESIKKVEGTVSRTTENVNGLIERGSVNIESGAAIAKRCGEVLAEIVENVSEVKTKMVEITSGAREIAEGVSNISTAMNQLDQATHENSDVAHKTSRYSTELSSQADQLNMVVNGLRKTILGTSDMAETPVAKTRENVVLLSQKDRKKASTPAPKAKGQNGSNGHGLKPQKVAVGAENVPHEEDPRFEEV